jgi:hypothetical protein
VKLEDGTSNGSSHVIAPAPLAARAEMRVSATDVWKLRHEIASDSQIGESETYIP